MIELSQHLVNILLSLSTVTVRQRSKDDCTCSIVPAICTCHMNWADAPANFTCLLHLVFALAICTCQLHLPDPIVSFTCYFHLSLVLPPASLSFTSTFPCTRVNPVMCLLFKKQTDTANFCKKELSPINKHTLATHKSRQPPWQL